MSYKVKLRTFEGPFDLLVYFIESAQMDIYDIKISEITDQYMAYIEAMKELDVAVGSEFMVLAAQLIEIKTKMLLPRKKDTEGNVIDEDPRSELVERLLEYRKYKEAARLLFEQGEYSLGIHEKPQEDISIYLDNPDEILDLDIRSFVKAFNQFIDKKQRVEAVKKKYVKVRRERESAEIRMQKILELVNSRQEGGVSFMETVSDAGDKYDVVLSFTSLLEMIKGRSVCAEQETMYGDIILSKMEDEE